MAWFGEWTPGRQGGGYLKRQLFQVGPIDGYLIRYLPGTGVQFHVDPVPNRRHYRLNIILKRPQQGGSFVLRGRSLVRFWRFRVFRPDLQPHAVETILKGERLVLSFGLAL